jgi:hypothetical protein
MNLSRLLAGSLLSLVLSFPAVAHEEVYFATLSGPAEAPPNESPGTGFARVTVDFDLVTMRVEASFSGLLGTTTASHIHCCTALPDEGTAGVATQTPTFSGFPLGVTAGTYDMTFDMTQASSYNAAFITAQGDIATAFNALTDAMSDGHAYFNIHTSEFGSGEIRGFLHQVPEPETYALMLVGLGVIGLAAKRRRH